MTLIPYKTLNFTTALSKDELINHIIRHVEFSKTKNFFTALTDDYLIKANTDKSKIEIEEIYRGNAPLPTKIIISYFEQESKNISVQIIPKKSGIFFTALFFLFILMVPFPLLVKLIFLGICYSMLIIAFNFDVSWTENLFKEKLLKKRD